ncbi:MAG: hypothetical protein RLZZ601_1675, partial [Pseudomonadota bacterium]
RPHRAPPTRGTTRAPLNASASRFAPSEFKVTLHGETFHINLTGSGHAGQEKRPFYVSIDGIAEEVVVETLSEIECPAAVAMAKRKP